MYKSKCVYQHHVTPPTNKRKNAFRFCWFSGITPSHSPQSNRDFLMDIFWKTISTYILNSMIWLLGLFFMITDNQQFKNAINPANDIIETKKKSFQNKKWYLYTLINLLNHQAIFYEVNQSEWTQKMRFKTFNLKKKIFFFRLAVRAYARLQQLHVWLNNHTIQLSIDQMQKIP